MKFEDVRFTSMQDKGVVETPDIETLVTMSFNESTRWTDETMPKQIIEHGKNPPLDIKKLHKSGINGSGVNVAIIDQPLSLNHPEYKNQIAAYKVFAPEGYPMKISSIHGPAVTSLLVGKNIGVANQAKLYYAAVPMWLGDAQYEVEALKWIMKINKTLSEKDKIKFVSVSAATGDKNLRPKNYELWNGTVKQAEKTGLCVLDCTEGHRFVSAGWVDYNSNSFHYGYPDKPMYRAQIGQVHVPNSLRTVAESYDNKKFSYTFNGVGGLSWGIPFATGVLCLGQQVNPNLNAMQLKKLLINSAAKNNCIVNPEGFIELVKTAETEKEF